MFKTIPRYLHFCYLSSHSNTNIIYMSICILIHFRIKREGLVPLKLSSDCLLTVQRRCFLWGSYLIAAFHVCLCYAVLSVPRSFVVACWETADLLTLLCVVFSCNFVTFPYMS